MISTIDVGSVFLKKYIVMIAKLFDNPNSINPIATIQTDDDYYINSEELDWIANIFGAKFIDYD